MIAALAWLGLSAWAASALPPIGEVLARGDGDNTLLRIEAFTAAGNVVVSRFVNVSGASYTTRGPVTVHDVETGEPISTGLTGDDEVIHVHWTGKWAIARRGPTTLLASLENGQTLIEHPHAAEALYRSGRLSPSGARFLIEADEGVRVWDVATNRLLNTFHKLEAPLFGDDNTFFAVRPLNPPIPTPNGPIQTESVRVDIDTGAMSKDDRRPVYDCGMGICSPSGEYGIYFVGDSPHDTLNVYHNGRMQPAWKLDLRRKARRFFLENPGLSFSDDSQEVRLSYQTGKHAIGVARWKASDGTPLTPLPDETKPVMGYTARSPNGEWSAHWGSPEERFAKWIPAAIQKWLLSTAPALVNKLAPERRIEVIDNRHDRIAAVIPSDANSIRFSPDSQALLVDNQRDLIRYPVPSGRLADWFLLGALPSVTVLLFARRKLSFADAPLHKSISTGSSEHVKVADAAIPRDADDRTTDRDQSGARWSDGSSCSPQSPGSSGSSSSGRTESR